MESPKLHLEDVTRSSVSLRHDTASLTNLMDFDFQSWPHGEEGISPVKYTKQYPVFPVLSNRTPFRDLDFRLLLVSPFSASSF